MTSFSERRKATVTLYPGNFQAELADLMERMLSEFRKEESGETPRRAGTKSKANALAREYDAKLTEAESAAVTVTLHEVSNMQWQTLTDAHPPRDGNDGDKRAGFDRSTFPAALVRESLAGVDIDLDNMSRAHFMKISDAAWSLHNADDAPPFGQSMVSLLKQYRESDSKLPLDSEQAPL